MKYCGHEQLQALTSMQALTSNVDDVYCENELLYLVLYGFIFSKLCMASIEFH